jgi:haloalkane dehalogenase
MARDDSPPDPPWLDKDAYPFRRRLVRVEGEAMHSIDEGQGPPIVFVHGTPTWSFEYRQLVSALSGSRRCIAPDHLGFGLSARPKDADYRPEAHARRFGLFMDALALDRFALVVHDYGGPIALDWAIENADRLEHLVVLNSWMWPFDEDPTMAKRARMVNGWLGRMLYRHANASLRMIMPSAYGDRSKLTREIHAQYLSLFPDPDSRELVLYALARALLGASDYYRSLWQRRSALARVPMTIVWGMKDSAFQPPFLARWEEAFPHARVVRLESAGHWPHEEEPERVLAALEPIAHPPDAPESRAPARA